MTAPQSTPRQQATRPIALPVCFAVFVLSLMVFGNAFAQPADQAEVNAFVELQETVRLAASLGLLADAQSDSMSANLADAPVYVMDLVVSDDLTEIHGAMEVRYTHRDDQPVGEVAFHLYANRIGGRITIGAAKVDGSLGAVRLSDEATVAWIELEEELKAGQSIAIALEFSMIIPTANTSHYGILTTNGRTASLAHVLPLLAIFDGQWRVDRPPDYGDVLYAESGFFLVALDVPANVAVAGTGFEVSRTALPSGRARVTVAAGPVRELYLALSTDLQESRTASNGTTIRVYAPPRQAARAEQAAEQIASALEILGGWLGEYPFTELDVVVGPTQAVGMEFPGAILVGESTFAYSSLDPVSGSGGPSFFEIVLVHETAHQWFHTIVGNDQTNQPWLDESVVQYMTWQYAEARYGPAGDAAFEQWLNRTYLLGGVPEAPLGLPTRAYSSGSYASVIYGKGPLFYAALEDEFGAETVLAALKEYLDAFRWRNGSTSAIYAALESSCGCSMAPWFEAWVYEN